MKKLFKPTILKKVIIGSRPRMKEACEEKIIDLFCSLGQEEKRIYEFITSYDTISEWLEAYLNDILEINLDKKINFVLDLLNYIISSEYYKKYYNEKDLDKILPKSIELTKKAVNSDLIKYSEKENKFIYIKSEKKEILNKDRYPELYDEFNSLKK